MRKGARLLALSLTALLVFVGALVGGIVAAGGAASAQTQQEEDPLFAGPGETGQTETGETGRTQTGEMEDQDEPGDVDQRGDAEDQDQASEQDQGVLGATAEQGVQRVRLTVSCNLVGFQSRPDEQGTTGTAADELEQRQQQLEQALEDVRQRLEDAGQGDRMTQELAQQLEQLQQAQQDLFRQLQDEMAEQGATQQQDDAAAANVQQVQIVCENIPGAEIQGVAGRISCAAVGDDGQQVDFRLMQGETLMPGRDDQQGQQQGDQEQQGDQQTQAGNAAVFACQAQE